VLKRSWHIVKILELMCHVCINYKTEDFVTRVKEETAGKGVDVILDNMGGSYLQRNIDNLNLDGRLFIIVYQGGATSQISLASLAAKRLTVQATFNRTPLNPTAAEAAAMIAGPTMNLTAAA
ncbi:hypothetical protein SOVF_189890, partial [Spinacia oleracea]